ncbi:hypothetical protein [Bacillus pseudomycoides]|uniref:hypothetical protein n=1 Tax=Bacillus pseudomycoides TaxID=64104 RepID=UPI002E1CE099|nr:hypothetical protein [Bacillus pseudomycoides]
MEDKTKMTAEQIIELFKGMGNGEKIKFLEYLYDNHFHSRPIEDMNLATKNYIEDNIERDLTEEETFKGYIPAN